jgi:hypothetical protein
VPESGKELLGHGPVMAKLRRILADEVPAAHAESLDPAQHIFAIHQLEALYLRPVGDRGQRSMVSITVTVSGFMPHLLTGTGKPRSPAVCWWRPVSPGRLMERPSRCTWCRWTHQTP